MAKRLVIHIGDPKTGSSSIQRVMIDHSFDCPALSVDYQPQLNAFPLANSLHEDGSLWAREQHFAEIADWLAKSQSDISVMSAELFFRVDPEVLLAALGQYLPDHADSARIVAYVRPHPGRFLSQFVQISKTGSYWGDMQTLFDRMSKRGTLLYAERFAAWRRVFGDRFTLRPMVRSELFGGDVVADFLNVALEGAPVSITGNSSSNESPSLQVLMGLRLMHQVLQRQDVPLDLRQVVGQYLIGHLQPANSSNGTKLRLPKEIYRQIVGHCAVDAETLDAAFFGKPIMADALRAAEADTIPGTIVTDPAQHYTEQGLVMVRKSARHLADLLMKDGNSWRLAFFHAIKQRPDGPELRERLRGSEVQCKKINETLERLSRILTQTVAISEERTT